MQIVIKNKQNKELPMWESCPSKIISSLRLFKFKLKVCFFKLLTNYIKFILFNLMAVCLNCFCMTLCKVYGYKNFSPGHK